MDISSNSYVEKIQAIMKSGRFGERNACKIVYTENTDLFKQWKEGISEIEFGKQSLI